ncbi:MAG: immunoglobulin domain-containing protein, partial [Limisphaerales bacterium]
VDVGANLSASIVNLGTGTYYFAATSYDVNRAESDLSNVTSTNFLDAPAIVAQSGNVSCTYGSTTNLKVTANGAAPLSYQWYSNSVAMVDGGNVTGSTTASITFNSAVDANQGNYQVVVANSIGTATSALMTLTVFDPPVIASQPTSLTRAPGSGAVFSISVNGAPPFNYQWSKNGTPLNDGGNILGAATATLTISATTASDAAGYRCIVANSSGSVTSLVATLTVLLPPSITTQPRAQTLNVGTTGVLSVAVSGTAPFTYSWSKDGLALANAGNISGANSANLTVASIADSDAGNYSCVVSNNVGSATSTAATVTVSDATVIITQPTNQTLNACDTLTLSVAVGGSPPQTYQWMHNGTLIGGATNSTYSVIAVTRADAGTYSVQVTGDTAINSSNAVVTVTDPIFLTQPADNCVTANTTNIFTAQACGTALVYQWYFASFGSATATSINGETNASLTIGPVTSKNIGQYFCVVTNDSGSITSRVASLGVEVAPTITSQPANQTKIVGRPVMLTVSATANSQMTFQWAKNGTNISGATASVYTIDSVQINDAGNYQCYVGTDLCQSTSLSSSNAGHLTVTADLIRPAVTFTYPTLNARFTNSYATHFGTITSTAPQIVISGSATDNSRVAGLTITRTFPPNAPMKIVPNLVGAPNSQRWTNAVSLVPGTNTFSAIVTDAAGWSSTNTLNLFLRVPSTLHVSTTGAGSTVALLPFTFGTATNTATLEIGRNYRISAKPAVGNVFSNWVNGSGAELSTAPTLVFRMSDNLQLVANFVTNPIVANNANGSYNGLFYQTNGVRVKSAGAIFNLLVRADATFSGTLKVDGGSYVLSGALDVHGDATKQIRRSGTTTLTAALHLNFVTKQMTGTIASPVPDAWTSVLMADIAPYSTVNHFPNSSRYTLAISPGAGAGTSPGGFGFGFVTNTSLGIISFIGTLADGTPISQTVPISQQGYWPFYIPLYGNRGLIQGWLNFSALAPGGNVSWIRPGGALTANYTNGFTNITQVFGSRYTPVTPSLNPADAVLDVGVPLLTFPYALSNNNAIVKLPGGPTNYLAGSISAPTGAVTITYRPTGGSANLTGRGAVLQWNHDGYGYVISNNVSMPFHLH